MSSAKLISVPCTCPEWTKESVTGLNVHKGFFKHLVLYILPFSYQSLCVKDVMKNTVSLVFCYISDTMK